MNSSTSQRHAWLLITVGDERQYGGNLGYQDELEHVYRYDSDVPNHKQLRSGDVVVLRDRQRALGLAEVVRIDEADATKRRRRCPACRSAQIKERKRTAPRFRCKRGHEFDEPVEETATCRTYAAQFGDSFIPVTSEISISVLRAACHKWNDQTAMQPIDLTSLRPAIQRAAPEAMPLLDGATCYGYPAPEEAAPDAEDQGEYRPLGHDMRQLVMRQIRERRGQQQFRSALLKRYGRQCMISRCSLVDLLEAAHIQSYRGEYDNHTDNGLLLRADLHTLFDLDLIGIDPDSLTVRVAPLAWDAGYACFDGERLLVGKNRPSAEALRNRWAAFRGRCDGGSRRDNC